jgi:hypothetical protein
MGEHISTILGRGKTVEVTAYLAAPDASPAGGKAPRYLVGPKARLEAVEYRKISCPGRNQTPVFQLREGIRFIGGGINFLWACEVWDPHDSGYEEYKLLRCEDLLPGRSLLTFRSNMSPLSAGSACKPYFADSSKTSTAIITTIRT